MFREITRKKQALSQEECLEILSSAKRGVLSVNGDDGYPYGMPLNHYYDPRDGRLYFHGGKVGHKIDAMRRDSKASFCVLDEGKKEPDSWYLHFRSVIVFGHIEFIEDPEKVIEIVRELSHKFTLDDAYIESAIAKDLRGTLMFALVPEQIRGKRIKEN